MISAGRASPAKSTTSTLREAGTIRSCRRPIGWPAAISSLHDLEQFPKRSPLRVAHLDRQAEPVVRMADHLAVHNSEAIDVDDDTLADCRVVGAASRNLVCVERLGLEELGVGAGLAVGRDEHSWQGIIDAVSEAADRLALRFALGGKPTARRRDIRPGHDETRGWPLTLETDSSSELTNGRRASAATPFASSRLIRRPQRPVRRGPVAKRCPRARHGVACRRQNAGRAGARRPRRPLEAHLDRNRVLAAAQSRERHRLYGEGSDQIRRRIAAIARNPLRARPRQALLAEAGKPEMGDVPVRYSLRPVGVYAASAVSGLRLLTLTRLISLLPLGMIPLMNSRVASVAAFGRS